ncbi:hypothetical protein M947_08160 [Sulfurimonas hongkongensis]|uniref:Amino acid permease n=1 Tax=Sulfurimonas hongkongensis TaxID=1172190 RepID=T0JDQ5_9BACT|nr:APC family permease [Sulfurimonas hongkongensis]EQB39125.1 hypothetical protein M947_08160 [Sulfurimonas hongkongensis]
MSEEAHDHKGSDYKKNSVSLFGAVAMGTNVMIGAGILALTGQIAELSGELFPLVFLAAAIVTAFSAYSYVKMANAYPSAGGIAMFLQKAYGKTTITAASGLLMYFSMVINESLVARIFGTYTTQLFDISPSSWIVAALGSAVLIFAFLLNLSGNLMIGLFSLFMASIKIGGIVIFALAGLWVADSSFVSVASQTQDSTLLGFTGAMALAILSYKGFTTITNSGSEITNPHKNVGRAIIISIVICVVIYFLVAVAVASNLSLSEIIVAKDYALAQAAKPAFGSYGLYFTVIIAIIATVSGIIASVFAVSRMLGMLSEMRLVPYKHFDSLGSVQTNTLTYTVVIAIFLTISFDLSRIASLGAIFYLVMDIVVHWGVFRHLRHEIKANALILISAIIFDVIILASFIALKISSDIVIVYAAVIAIVLIFFAERVFLSRTNKEI